MYNTSKFKARLTQNRYATEKMESHKYKLTK